MGYYSFEAIARQPVAIPYPMILLDSGLNVFTAQTDDLENLLATLKAEGVTVRKVHQLDGLAPVPATETLLLPNERDNEVLQLSHGSKKSDP